MIGGGIGREPATVKFTIEFLKRINQILKDDGYFIIYTPNLDNAIFKSNKDIYFKIVHNYYFTPET